MFHIKNLCNAHKSHLRIFNIKGPLVYCTRIKSNWFVGFIKALSKLVFECYDLTCAFDGARNSALCMSPKHGIYKENAATLYILSLLLPIRSTIITKIMLKTNPRYFSYQYMVRESQYRLDSKKTRCKYT